MELNNPINVNDYDNILFTYDSPMFIKKLDESMNEIHILGEFLQCILQLMKKLYKDLKSISKCSEAISLQMNDGITQLKSLNESKYNNILHLFNNIINDISNSQDILSETIQQTFIIPLEDFYNNSILQMNSLKLVYHKEKQLYDDLLIKYLHYDSNNNSFVRNNNNQFELKALELVQCRYNLESTRYMLINLLNDINSRQSYEFIDSCISTLLALKSHHHECSDRLDNIDNVINNYSNIQMNNKKIINEKNKFYQIEKSKFQNVLMLTIERIKSYINIDSDNNTNLSNNSNAVNNNDINVAATMNKLGQFGANIIGNFSKRQSLDSNIDINNYNNSHLIRKKSLYDITKEEKESNNINIIDIEMKLKALDITHLQPFYNNDFNKMIHVDDSSTIIKQGYVLEKVSSNKLMQSSHWIRRWLILDNNKLYFLNDNLDSFVICDIMLTSIKTNNLVDNIPYVFEISYANFKSYILQAEGSNEYNSWIDSIRNTIEKKLVSNTSNNNVNTQSNNQITTTKNQKFDYINTLMERNSFCVECSKNLPDWVSLNLGCLLCIDCSGVHRSLGVHISKVRSLTLDDLENEEYELLLKLGNEINHSIYESNLINNAAGNSSISLPNKPIFNDDYSTREKFIRSKYELKSFISINQSNPLDLKYQLLVACANDNVIDVMYCLAQGVVINPWVNDDIDSDILSNLLSTTISTDRSSSSNESYDDSISNDLSNELDDNNQSINYTNPLHISCQFGSLSCVVLLVLNGVDMFSSTSQIKTQTIEENDDNNMTIDLPCIKIAKLYNHYDIYTYLIKKIELLGSSNHNSSRNNMQTIPSSKTIMNTNPNQKPKINKNKVKNQDKNINNQVNKIKSSFVNVFHTVKNNVTNLSTSISSPQATRSRGISFSFDR